MAQRLSMLCAKSILLLMGQALRAGSVSIKFGVDLRAHIARIEATDFGGGVPHQVEF